MFRVNDFEYDTSKFAEHKIVYKAKGKIRPVEGKRFFSIGSTTGQRIITQRVQNIESLRAKPQPYFEANGFKYDPSKFADFKVIFRDGKIRYYANNRFISLGTKMADRMITKYVGNKNLLKWIAPKKEEKEIKEEKEFKFSVDRKTGFINHFINNPQLNTNEIDPILGRVGPAIRDAKRRMGITNNGMLHIKFVYSARMEGKEVRYISKSFTGIKVGDFVNKFRENYQKYIDLNLSSGDPNHDYTRTIDKIV